VTYEYIDWENFKNEFEHDQLTNFTETDGESDRLTQNVTGAPFSLKRNGRSPCR
jgi:hypothetical protein